MSTMVTASVVFDCPERADEVADAYELDLVDLPGTEWFRVDVLALEDADPDEAGGFLASAFRWAFVGGAAGVVVAWLLGWLLWGVA